MTCNQINEEDFHETELPLKPGFFEGILWFDIEISKPENFDDQRYILYIEDESVDFAEAFIQTDMGWRLLGRTGTGIPKEQMSLVTSIPLIPLMKNLFSHGNTTHVRLRMTSSKGTPVKISLISNTNLYTTSSRALSSFSFNGGIGIVLFLGLLITGIFLKDPAYIFLAFSSLLYILRAMQTRGTGPILLWNFLSETPVAGKFEYIMYNIEVLLLAISSHYFINTRNEKTLLSKTFVMIIELFIIEFILILIIDSKLTMFLSYLIISIVQKVLLLFIIASNIRNKDTESIIIFIPWMIVFSFSVIFRIMLLLRNFTPIDFPEFIKLNNMVTSTPGFILLATPPLYSLGMRFNRRFQFIQKEYQELETKLIKDDKTNTLVHSVTMPIAQLSSSVLNSASILSKLNFSASNAEYIEMIKGESARINDLLCSIRIIDGIEKPENSPILLLDFFNSCIANVKRQTINSNCTPSFSNAIPDDVIVSADVRILQLVFITITESILSLSKAGTKFTVYLEEGKEKDGTILLTIGNTIDDESLDTPAKILQKLNENTYFDFIVELAKIYDLIVSIYPLEESCRTTLRLKLDKIEDIGMTMVVVDKTTFEMSDNSFRLLKDKLSTTKRQRTSEDSSVDSAEETSTPQIEKKKNTATNLSRISAIEKEEQSVVKDIFERYDFSTREKEIATLIIEGKSDKEIAYHLNISPQTVATHNKKIFKKAEVHSRVELINKVR
ncbi:MAG: hypothetical protein KBS64_07895 [Treponema sp.]|nr:hypothetical protein [Candidatus Treponema equi]